MFLKEILNSSSIAFTATVNGKESLTKLERFRPYTEALIERFPHVILAMNSLSETTDEEIAEYKAEWLKMAPKCVILHSEVNRGHMFGTIDLEESILKYIKESLPDVKYLWKSADDMIVSTELLDIEVPEAEFYYLPGFSYESILRAGSKENLIYINRNEIFESGLWTPQTPFFILNVDSVHNLYGDDVEYKIGVYQDCKRWKPAIKPWEVEFDIKFDCETHLARTVRFLKKHCLVKDQLEDLIDFVMFNRVGDPSHKNIYFEKIGVCHYHFYNDLIYNV